MAYDRDEQDKRKKKVTTNPEYTPIKVVGCAIVVLALIAWTIRQCNNW